MKIPKYFYFRVKVTHHGTGIEVEDASDVDVEEVVRCRECIHGRFKHQDMYECLHDADIDESTGVPYGFIDYHEPDFFCAYGEKEEAK